MYGNEMDQVEGMKYKASSVKCKEKSINQKVYKKA